MTTLTATVALLAPAAASGATNTFTMRAEIALSGPPGSPSPTSPARLGYRWITHADTDPPGSQPDTITTLTIAIPRATSNARYFPSCTQAEIDGRQSFPESCRPAIVGYGNASAYAGSPGSPASNSVKEDLTFLLVNGSGGNQLLMVVSSAPAAPIAITNRVIPGDVGPGGGDWAFSYEFKVPADLQQQLGLAISFADITATIPGTARTFSTGTALRSGSFLETTDCATSMASEGTAVFVSSTGSTTAVVSSGGSVCAHGTFPDPNAPEGDSALPPPQQGETANVALATPCDSLGGPPVAPEQCRKLCPASGCVVRIRVPGSNSFLVLEANSQVPFGATLDTSNGAVRLSSAAGGGQLQTGIFYGGVFTVTQAVGNPITELKLAALRRRSCGARARRSAQSRKKKGTPSLWSNAKGKFRTRGEFAAATALGTKWLTTETCTGTRVKVTQGAVAVRDLPKRRTVTVRAGRSYLAARR